ncbi:sialin-like [Phymastichus coffea]|uniref:sialin-like n=1 Tax=Phymastichus coffea TaxID=108790 RepID=UPI00273BB1B3|nr:sialin-like [Phymastichus coffea]
MLLFKNDEIKPFLVYHVSFLFIVTGISQRCIFTIMAFFGIWITHAIRVILSILITEMVPPPTESSDYAADSCVEVEEKLVRNVTSSNSKVYNWDEYTQGLILSSYFWGYAATHFPFGSLSERFGGKHLLAFGNLLPSILTILIPSAIELGDSSALITLRVAMGVISSSMYPAMSTMIAQWATPAERTKIGCIVFAGSVVGTIFGLTLPAVIIHYTSVGWQGVFYIFGAIGIIWFPLWMLLCYESPDVHPFISEPELEYFQNSTLNRKQKKIPPAPWSYILTSKQVWAFVLAMFGLDWAYYTMASDLPKYMNSIMKLSIEENGYLSSLPYLCMWINSIVSSWLINKITEKQWMSLTNVRKLFTTISMTGPAFFIMAASYSDCHRLWVIAMIMIGMMLMGCSYPSVVLNNIDLSPNYSGTLSAFGNGVAAIGGVLTPYIVGILTPNQTIMEWRLVFWIVFIVAAISNLNYLIFGSAKVQEWNDPEFLKRQKTTAASEKAAIQQKV